METKPVTLSVIKADVGSLVGHVQAHPDMLTVVKEHLARATEDQLLADYHVANVGDDIELIMTHYRGSDSEKIHGLAWDAFMAAAEVARRLKLYAAGQDLLSDAFSGNVKGMGPGVAEITFNERPSEPVVVFMADKTDPGAWNLPLYKMFADPFTTIGLVIDPKMHDGFIFEVHDLVEHKKVTFSLPEELYDLLVFIGSPGRYCIKRVYSKKNGELAAATSTQRLNQIAGRYVGKDDPVCIVRCQNGLPAVGEVLEAFAEPHLVAGWMRGSHYGPLLPVAEADSRPTRFDGPARVVALGFQLCNGRLVGPVDFFADKGFDRAREKALELADYLRRLGPFEPHRLALDHLEYTTLPLVAEKLKGRFQPIE
ncbi:fructose-1,6-bisphosphate aldolase/phosphatase [Gelria sp. Kuro-4]|uniref:fructose-1,6-bisphosphate aldolase/phosphatase n=1 Tax=Gelria sp. Kuro-4 TaxID=2796927 RepID=UPI001BEEC589|nr:fructose-1,6-bisphosphate aldolase/phosphatase [Gelria sp. Kuro-4]BCV24137.1 fructose-1,6-bisphosphate aldolase/phosphatase [Gelria sp. Kuro-4]